MPGEEARCAIDGDRLERKGRTAAPGESSYDGHEEEEGERRPARTEKRRWKEKEEKL
jgi:hypothetical protein